MKEAAPHIANPALQRTAEPFFQRSAEKGKDDNAFFSSIQTKLSVGAKDDTYEKEADAMADKVVNSPAAAEQVPTTAAESTVQKKTDASLNTPSPLQAQVQARFESDSTEEKLQKKEEEGNEEQVLKKPVATDGQDAGTVQRMCRECDEGDKIFRSADPDVSGMSKRDAVIAMAKTMLGKIKAKQPGAGGQREGADKLWEIFKLAAPGVWQEDDIKTFGKPYPSWCGIFSVWAHKKAGIDLGNWQMGKGVSAFGTLKQTTSPQPGDIGYIDQPFQHHCIITKVNGATIDSIDGNSGLFSEVIENTRPAKAYSGFFTAFSGSDSGTVSKKDIEGSIQKQADGSAGTAPSSVETSLASSKGSGSSLPATTKTEMESGLGADFSNVKIHTGSNAAQMSKDLNAQAFTHGSDVYFNSNKFNPDTSSGKHLLAHELTHTMQQGAAPAIQKKPSLTGLKIQKAAPKTTDKYKGSIKKDDVDVDVSGKLYTLKFKSGGKEYKLDLGKNPAEIYLPEISMPYLKHRNASRFPAVLMSLAGRGETKQKENWNASVKDAVRQKVEDLTKGVSPNSKGAYFFCLRQKSDFHMIGTKDEITERSNIPKWNKDGLPNEHQVDHIVEYQLGGNDGGGAKPNNYELLDALANTTSGNNIKIERFSRIAQGLDYFRQYNTLDSPAKFPGIPLDKEAQSTFIQYYAKVADWKLPYDGNGEMFWTFEHITDGKHLKHLTKMSQSEQQKLEGSSTELLIYVSESLGSPKRVPLPVAATKDYFKGMDLKQIGDNKNIKDGDKIIFHLTEKFSKRLNTNQDIEFGLKEVAGRTNAFYIQSTKDFNKGMFTKFEGASPVTINDLSLDENYGLVLNGTITADLPLLKGLIIDFLANGPDLNFRALVDLDVVGANFPKIFKLTKARLIFGYKSADNILSLEGSIAFEIEKLGWGEITAKTLGEKDGFEVSGKFHFDKSILDGSIDVTYNSVKGWTIKGDANIVGGKKLKGVKDGKIHFEYNQAEETFTLGGTAHLTVPGISEITIDSKIGKDGDFEIKAAVTLAKIPRIKSGKVTVTIGKSKPKDGQPAGDSDWDMGMEGTIEPDFNYGGLSDVVVTFGYSKGAYDIGISAKYKKGKFHADKIEAGVTNKPVSKDGKKQEGEPTDDMTFYGGFEMGVDVYDGIGGTITCQLLPDGDVTLDGKVEVKEDKELFSMKPWEKELLKVDKDIPIASCVVVTLNLYIGGQIKLYADLKPLMIKTGSYLKVGNLSLKKFDDPVITSKIILGSSLVAGAKVSLAIGLSASLLGVIKARIAGVADVNFVAIEAAVTGILEMGWSKETGIDIKEASIDLEMASKLIVSFGVKAEVLLDLWLTTITLWDHEWPVAADTIPIDIFGEGKKTWKLPLQSGGKVGEPDHATNMKSVSDKTSPDEVQSRAKDKSEGVQRPKVDKQAQVQQVTQDEVLANFRDPRRFNFDSSENYLETRYGLYDYLKLHSGEDPKIDLNFIDEEIKKAEFEEYDAFTTFIMSDASFSDDAKSMIIEDFIVNHPTLGETEKVNLRSLIPVKAPASQKASAKDRGKTVPKKTPEITTPVRPVQAKAKASGSKKTGSVTSRTGKQVLKNRSQKNTHKTGKRTEFNEFTEMEEGLFIPDMELSTNHDLYNNDFEDMEQDDTTALNSMNDIENGTDDNNEDNHFKPFYMRSTRTRKPLQQRAEEKSRSAFFSGPEKKEKSNNGAFFQAKLNVGEANDPMEKEADKVADSVTGKGKPKEDRKEDIAKGAGVGKPEQEANKGKTPGADKPAVEDKKEKDKTSVQKKGKQEETEEENKTVVNKKDSAAVPATASAAKGQAVESAIAEKSGKGGSMPANVLQEMQSAIGHDFGDVHIHTDSDAAALSEELDAQAFTTGKDIYFNSGKFDPESESGKHLLAHELTHVVQQNKDTIRRDPKADKEEKTRAQTVRDDYQKALKAKVVHWEEVATLFNAFNEPEQREKMAQLGGAQLFQLHQGAVNAAGVGPYSAAATMTTPVPDMPAATAAAIETQMIHYNYQAAIDLIVEDLDKRGVINRSLLTGGTMRYLEKKNIRGEGRVVAPGFDQKTGKAKMSDANIGADAFSPSAGLPLLYSTVIHEFQHVEQMQKPGDSKAEIPDQGNDDQTHIQQEVEAYSTELIRAKESGMYNIPDQVQDTWSRLHNKWQDLTDDTKKRKVNELYKKAHEVAQQALGKSLHLIFTPLKP